MRNKELEQASETRRGINSLPSDFTHRNLGRVEAETEGLPFTTLDIISLGCLFMVLSREILCSGME